MPVIRGTCGVINDISLINDQMKKQTSERGFNSQQFNAQLPQLNPQYQQLYPAYPQFNPQLSPQYIQYNPQYPQYVPPVIQDDFQSTPVPQFGVQGGEVSRFNPDISLGIPKTGPAGAAFPTDVPKAQAPSDAKASGITGSTPGPELQKVIDSLFKEKINT